MYAHEVLGQVLLHLLHRQEGDDRFGLAFEPHFQIFAHGFHVADISHVHFHDTVVGFQKQVVVAAAVACRRCQFVGQPLFQSVGSALKVLQSEWFEQIVDRVHLEALDGVLRIGGCKHDEWGHGERLHEVHAVEVGHVDIAEDGVHGFLFQPFPCIECTLTLASQFQERHLTDIGNDLLQSQWLIVDSETTYLHSGMVSSTV